MENDNKQELELENKIETEGGEEGGNEGGEPEKKPELTPEQIKGIKQRKLTKLAKELGVELPNPEAQKPPVKEEKGFGYAEKAYLKASGISPDEFDFVQEVMEGTGKDIEGILESKYFQAELKERRDAQAVKAATPKGTSRSAVPKSDSAEYWVSKIQQGAAQLLDIQDVGLRRKVNNALYDIAKDSRKFTNRPIA